MSYDSHFGSDVNPYQPTPNQSAMDAGFEDFHNRIEWLGVTGTFLERGIEKQMLKQVYVKGWEDAKWHQLTQFPTPRMLKFCDCMIGFFLIFIALCILAVFFWLSYNQFK